MFSTCLIILVLALSTSAETHKAKSERSARATSSALCLACEGAIPVIQIASVFGSSVESIVTVVCDVLGNLHDTCEDLVKKLFGLLEQGAGTGSGKDICARLGVC
ncbi:hypothetical protein CRM22_003428 [Opisthorchis felineus]|uniref:Saposin B-type domain-containing protein n=1 Tax=Opisthorchis felineus TaxID=147828 RepID=A0A4S2M181_OPIFE|nr:hypothetical protein CRM22_003428 [Opisthorchis felineus]